MGDQTKFGGAADPLLSWVGPRSANCVDDKAAPLTPIDELIEIGENFFGKGDLCAGELMSPID